MVIDVRRRHRGSPQKDARLSNGYRVFHRGRDITANAQKVDGRRHLAIVLRRNAEGRAFVDPETRELARDTVRGVKLRRKRGSR
jgi:hypothetical protein